MQFKHKLIYFALGCAFVVLAQVLLSIVVPKVTAQGKKISWLEEAEKRGLLEGKKEAVEFDKVKVRSLEVVDASGKVYALLEKTPRNATADDVIQVFNSAGISVCCVSVSTDGGQVNVYGKGGKPGASMNVSDGNGLICVAGNEKLSVMMGRDQANNGFIQVSNDDGKKCALMGMLSNHGGFVSVYNNDGEPHAAITAGPNGGVVSVFGNSQTRAAIGVDDYGHGVVNTWDKNGRKTR